MQTEKTFQVPADDYQLMKKAVSELVKVRTKLEDAEGKIEDLENQVISVGEDYDKAEEEASELRGQLRDLEWQTEDDIQELAKARTALFNGKIDEGRELLERVLDRNFGDKWRLFC